MRGSYKATIASSQIPVPSWWGEVLQGLTPPGPYVYGDSIPSVAIYDTLTTPPYAQSANHWFHQAPLDILPNIPLGPATTILRFKLTLIGSPPFSTAAPFSRVQRYSVRHFPHSASNTYLTCVWAGFGERNRTNPRSSLANARNLRPSSKW